MNGVTRFVCCVYNQLKPTGKSCVYAPHQPKVEELGNDLLRASSRRKYFQNSPDASVTTIFADEKLICTFVP